MAYVRKTQEFYDAVVNNVQNMKNKAVSVYPLPEIERGSPEYSHTLEAINTAAYRDAPHLKDQYPDTWKKTVSKGVKVDFHREDGAMSFSTNIDCEHVGLQVPAHISSGYFSTTIAVFRSDCPAPLQTWYDEQVALNGKRSDTAEKYATVEDQIKRYMSQHASLNGMLKDMPEFEMYVPQKYMDKFHEEVEPRAKKQQQSIADDIGIDRDAIAAIAIANRVTV
jgi:hypothetical protein